MRLWLFRLVICSGSVFLSSMEDHSPAPEIVLRYLLNMNGNTTRTTNVPGT
jgi:hypothetical protein